MTRDEDAVFTAAGTVLGRVFQSSDGYWYRMISQSASHAEGTILQYVPGTAGGYACETGYASTVACKPAGVVVSGKTAAGIQPVLIKGRHSAVVIVSGTSSSASVQFGYNSAGAGITFASSTYPIGFYLASKASTLEAADAWIDIY